MAALRSAVAAVKMVGAGVGEVAEADAHVADDRVGEGDGEGDAEDRVGDGQGVEVAVAQEEQAGGESHDEGHGGEDGAGEVGDGEDGGGGERGEAGGG